MNGVLGPREEVPFAAIANEKVGRVVFLAICRTRLPSAE